MSQALYTSMGGINAATTAISVVSNNVANINTTAFKAANARFENLFSKTYTTGNSPTKTTGGVNPMQVGMGVQVGSIVRNFSDGSFVSTGNTNDLMVSGGGYFTVMDAHGEIFLTRDGAFTLDSQGNMVNQSGFYVLGASQLYNTSGSQAKINVPQSIKTEAIGNEHVNTTYVKDLNDASITAGTFTVKFSNNMGSQFAELNIRPEDLEGSVDALVTSLTNQLTARGMNNNVVVKVNDDGTVAFKAQPQYDKTVSDKLPLLVTDGEKAGKTVDCYKFQSADTPAVEFYWSGSPGSPIYDGAGQIYKAADGTNCTVTATSVTATAGVDWNITALTPAPATPATLTIPGAGVQNRTRVDKVNPTIEFTAGSSNFLEATRLASAEQTTDGFYMSKVLDYTVKVEPVAALSEAVNLKSYSVANDGTIEATYSNGDKITVEANKQDNTFGFKYTTATGVVIRGTDHISINPNIATPENMVLQMATVTNEAGLVSLNNNMWSVGPNTGEMVFAVGGSMGMGEIQTGGLEGSNVDLSMELSNMILAQRAIQANSRVFSTASTVMESLTYLGQ